MSDSGTRRIGMTVDVKPHAYDPVTQPELFEGVLSRRVIAFFIDLLMIGVPLLLLAMFILVFGLFTLGFGWFLFLFYGPLTVIWALIYYGLTLGGAASATVGMRMVGLEMRTWYGEPSYFVLGAAHGLFFWLSMSLTPFILLIAFFNDRKRLLHDMVLGSIVVNSEARARGLRNAGRPL